MADPDPDKLQEYFSVELPGKVTDEELLALLLLVVDEKPGALVMGASSSEISVLKRFCSRFDLGLKVVKGEKRSVLGRIIGKDRRFIRDSIFITKDSGRFQLLEDSQGDFCGFSDRAVGKFLGYPEEEIEYYVDAEDGEPAAPETFDKIEELENEDVIGSGDQRYIQLVSYLPEPDPESIKKAIKEGKRREELLLDLDEELGISVAQELIKHLMEEGT